MEHSNRHTNKRILARGCDPHLSAEAAKFIPKEIGNPIYIPTTNDLEFLEKIKTEKWSLIYFAPGACRFSLAKERIPGTNINTQNWQIEDYEKEIKKHQGNIPVVQSIYEADSIDLLNTVLDSI